LPIFLEASAAWQNPDKSISAVSLAEALTFSYFSFT